MQDLQDANIFSTAQNLKRIKKESEAAESPTQKQNNKKRITPQELQNKDGQIKELQTKESQTKDDQLEELQAKESQTKAGYEKVEQQDVPSGVCVGDPARPPTILALATPYDVPRSWKFYDARSNATERMVDLAANLVRRAARLGKLPLVDYRRAFRGSRRPLSELVDIWGHPTSAGVAVAWSALQRALGLGLELE